MRRPVSYIWSREKGGIPSTVNAKIYQVCFKYKEINTRNYGHEMRHKTVKGTHTISKSKEIIHENKHDNSKNKHSSGIL